MEKAKWVLFAATAALAFGPAVMAEQNTVDQVPQTLRSATDRQVAAGSTLKEEAGKKEGEKEEKDEVQVKLADVPAAVKATLDQEAAGATLPDQVDKESQEGKTIYEADVMIKGKNYEIKVAEDGTLVSKKLDVEEKEGKEADEKKEKKDKD